jgi:hypothetical protein
MTLEQAKGARARQRCRVDRRASCFPTSRVLARAGRVFPQRFRDALWQKYEINVDDPAYGAWWETSSHRQYWYNYNVEWERFMIERRTRDEVIEFGRNIAKKYGLTVKF